MDDEGNKRPGEGASSLMGLFAPPPPAAAKSSGDITLTTTPITGSKPIISASQFGAMARDAPLQQPTAVVDRRSTVVSSNQKSPKPLLDNSEEFEALFDSPKRQQQANERTPLVPRPTDVLGGIFHPPLAPVDSVSQNDITPKVGSGNRKAPLRAVPNLPSIRELSNKQPTGMQQHLYTLKGLKSSAKDCLAECIKPTTLIGSFMFLLYHIVFCLAMGSAITRPHGGQVPILGLMTKMASLGIMFGACVYWFNIGSIPALYPTVDLFSAPFLAVIAAIVDETLHNDPDVSEEENDQVFLGTFTFLACLAIFISGALLVLASVFKLANLGAFLPFPVLCGFFAAVGVLTWTLAFKVDTNGKSVGEVFFSGDWELIGTSLCHHAPSVLIAASMKYFGPKNPLYVVGIVVGSIGLFYATMFAFGISLEEAIERNWFWSESDLVYENMDSGFGFAVWCPPAPFGLVNSFLQGQIHWGACKNGMQTTVALAFLYLIRCSLHGAALKKNVPNLSRIEKAEVEGSLRRLTKGLSSRFVTRGAHRRKFSEVLDIEHMVVPDLGNASGPAATVVNAKPTQVSLKDILFQYGISQFICGAVGGFAITPSVAASPTMYMLGAEGLAPQVGSVLLLSIFYLTDFQLVAYIPKPAFSSLLVLAFLDMISTWFIQSYSKTKEKMEWLVVPLIVVLAFVVGLLSSVFLGIAMSTFLFVASFNRSGVVKYVANGLNIRSTIERSLKTGRWLDRHGDQIQVIVLQNYLFFGNATSILHYLSSMFEEPSDEIDELFLPPFPRVVVLDMTLVTGMDTSAVDVISDSLALFSKYDTKLFLSGVSLSMRHTMALSGVKPETIRDRSKRKLRFFSDLDAAIGKAEDLLLDDEGIEEEVHHRSGADSGFLLALHHIDEQHETNFASELVDLETFTTLVEVTPGELLYGSDYRERGLFFIESGVMKIERNADFTLSRAGSNEINRRMSMNNNSLNQLNARSGSIGKEMARLKEGGGNDASSQRFRLARIGPGWVLGSIEAVSGTQHPGSHVAVTHCRLHYIPYKKIDDMEDTSPKLVLRLHKLISYLMAKRQEITIGQLATLHSIMSAPAQKKPIGRNASSTLGGSAFLTN